MADACGIVRSRYRARTGAGYVLVFLQQPGGLVGVLTALMGLMLSGSLYPASRGPHGMSSPVSSRLLLESL